MDFDIKKKRVKIMLVALIGIICYAFLPYVKMSFDGLSFTGSFFSSKEYAAYAWDFFGKGCTFLSIVGILCIAALIGIVVTGYLKKDSENLLCCFGGAIAGLLSLITAAITFGGAEDTLQKMERDLSVSIGWGHWLGVIALIACAAMAFLLPEDEQ